MLEMKMRARATWETGREGKGLMSMSEPVRASCSSCQPGKVARRRKTMKARTMATMLEEKQGVSGHQRGFASLARGGRENGIVGSWKLTADTETPHSS